ncbi:hypothetical protein NX059_012125 [Plenodomus lindquistii]|nr:hypothetical protein NX059_012141 [Plenodomus lindquistii]KAI8930755.1 hypothetical protein NX059_012363 [Plenodomus lindquistii]KAI8931115.1 hypothetical protein NX059_012125 [Plenodomus lindquistii]
MSARAVEHLYQVEDYRRHDIYCPQSDYRAALVHALSSSPEHTRGRSVNAGWVILPDPLHPIIVAHSLLGALCVIYDAVPPGIVPERVWSTIRHAVAATGQPPPPDADDIPSRVPPPSAQPNQFVSRDFATVPGPRVNPLQLSDIGEEAETVESEPSQLYGQEDSVVGCGGGNATQPSSDGGGLHVEDGRMQGAREESTPRRSLEGSSSGLEQPMSQPAREDPSDVDMTDAPCNSSVARTQTEDETADVNHVEDATADGEDDVEPHAIPALLTTTVTNNNRAAEKRRIAKAERRRQDRLSSLGLLPPSSKAPAVELVAYQSITRLDEDRISWLFKQPTDGHDFYTTARTPFHTGVDMLKKARELGNYTSRLHASSFLQTWRAIGSPLPRPSRRMPAIPLEHETYNSTDPSFALSQATQGNTVPFERIWHTVSLCEAQLAAVHVQYRWAMAFLARAFEQETQALLDEDNSVRRSGRGRVRVEAKKRLYAKLSNVDWAVFGVKLKRARKWYKAVCELGWGILCLMPYDIITNTWVEQVLRVSEWDVWLQLVHKVNPGVIQASRQLDRWLGAACIAGGPITHPEILQVEAVARQGPARVFLEVRDSDDDDESSEDEADGETPTRAASSTPSREHLKSLGQLSIVELFQPVQKTIVA